MNIHEDTNTLRQKEPPIEERDIEKKIIQVQGVCTLLGDGVKLS